jgi:hypothetical protein
MLMYSILCSDVFSLAEVKGSPSEFLTSLLFWTASTSISPLRLRILYLSFYHQCTKRTMSSFAALAYIALLLVLIASTCFIRSVVSLAPPDRKLKHVTTSRRDVLLKPKSHNCIRTQWTAPTYITTQMDDAVKALREVLDSYPLKGQAESGAKHWMEQTLPLSGIIYSTIYLLLS